jgi:hypothetical protein
MLRICPTWIILLDASSSCICCVGFFPFSCVRLSIYTCIWFVQVEISETYTCWKYPDNTSRFFPTITYWIFPNMLCMFCVEISLHSCIRHVVGFFQLLHIYMFIFLLLFFSLIHFFAWSLISTVLLLFFLFSFLLLFILHHIVSSVVRINRTH